MAALNRSDSRHFGIRCHHCFVVSGVDNMALLTLPMELFVCVAPNVLPVHILSVGS